MLTSAKRQRPNCLQAPTCSLTITPTCVSFFSPPPPPPFPWQDPRSNLFEIEIAQVNNCCHSLHSGARSGRGAKIPNLNLCSPNMHELKGKKSRAVRQLKNSGTGAHMRHLQAAAAKHATVQLVPLQDPPCSRQLGSSSSSSCNGAAAASNRRWSRPCHAAWSDGVWTDRRWRRLPFPCELKPVSKN